MSLQYLADLESLPEASHQGAVLAVYWTSHAVLSSDIHGVIKAWHPETSLPFQDLPQPHKNAVQSLSSNANKSMVLSSSIDGSVALWDLSNIKADQAEPKEITQDQKATIEELQLPLPEGLLVATSESIADTASSVSEAWSTALHPTLPQFASAGIGARITIHSTDPSTFGSLLETVKSPAESNLFGMKLCYNADASLLAVGTDSGQVFLYDDQLELVASYADHASPIRALSFAPNYHLLVGCDDKTVTVHDVKDHRAGGTVACLQGHAGWVMSVSPSPVAEGRIIASSSTDNTIKLWDLGVSPKSCVCTCVELDQVRCLDWKPSPPSEQLSLIERATSTTGLGQGSKFVTGGQDGRVRWYRSAGV